MRRERTKHSLRFGKIETDCILIKEKRKQLTKMSDRVSRNVLERKRLKFE